MLIKMYKGNDLCKRAVHDAAATTTEEEEEEEEEGSYCLANRRFNAAAIEMMD